MVVIDQFTRRIIGFSIQKGNCDCIAYCRLFNQIISGRALPTYLSSDNDPLFLFHRWKANLRIVGVEEIKFVPGVPTSHPFIERTIGSVRRECLDQQLFFNRRDLQNKLNTYQKYFNETRGHSSMKMKTPQKMASDVIVSEKTVAMNIIAWKSHCRGLYKFPVAA